MAKFFGLSPKAKTKKVAEEFENRVCFRLNNQRLMPKVYTDITDEQWAVAFAYNQVLDPGLWGTENSLEIKYSYQPDTESVVQRLETKDGYVKSFPAEPFDTPDAFVIWALNQERNLVNPT